MNLEELAQQVKSALSVSSEERVQAYEVLVGVARKDFPEFAQAMDVHRDELIYSLYKSSGTYVRTQDSKAYPVFQRFFSAAQGLAMMYSIVMRAWYAKKRTTAASGWWYQDEGSPVWVHVEDKTPKGML